MKGSIDRTKVVVRHLPPTISQSNIVEHIDSRFSGRYQWLSFHPGKLSLKHLTHSRVYINFSRPEDVIYFADFFNGHVFVNEKGAQFKAIVEYAPSQRVPNQWFKKDGREGTLLKDPDYSDFLEFLAKPVENLPSAEIQLERKEAQRAGAPKNVPIVTPLMEYVRQKRVARVGARRTVLNGKTSRRVGGISSKSPAPGSLKNGSEKRRTSTTMYALRDNSKGVGSKDKSSYLLVPKHDNQQLAHKSATLDAVSGTDVLEREGASGSTGIVKEKILLLKGKEKEISNVSGGSSLQQNALASAPNTHSSAPLRRNQRRETNGRIIRTILLNKDTCQNKPSPGSQSDLRNQASIQDRHNKHPLFASIQSLQKETNDVPKKVANSELHADHTEKQERRATNKDRPDPVWAPLRRSEGSHASDDSLSSSASRNSQVLDSADLKNEMLGTRAGNYRPTGSGRNSPILDRNSQDTVENGSYRNGGPRGLPYNVKSAYGSMIVEGKPFKRGGSTGYGSQEKQVWIQKSSSGS